ncbi:MAG: response regulator [Anaerolineales bacterium]|nr:response regulator [Anaerolineales bacterium]
MNLPTIPITNKHILIVENDANVRQVIAKVLEIEGYLVQQSQDGAAALRFVEKFLPDLIISDINIPDVNGGEFFQTMRQNAQWTTIPFIFLTSNASPEAIQRGRELGVEDYLVKPIDPDNLVRIVSARLLRAAELKIALIDQAYLETIKVLANTVEGRDPYTHGHVERVTIYAQWLAEQLGWPPENLRILQFGARLHDIGKIIVPDQILKKPGDLNTQEWELMRQHPAAGAKILNSIEHLKSAAAYVLYHHERWDGSGYPHGLQGRDIPIEGRLLAIADVYDALTTTRPYHPARPRSQALKYLTERAGILFDPDLVPNFIEVLDERTRMLS